MPWSAHRILRLKLTLFVFRDRSNAPSSLTAVPFSTAFDIAQRSGRRVNYPSWNRRSSAVIPAFRIDR